MRKKLSKTEESVRVLVDDVAKGLGMSLWDVKFVKEGSMWYLRIFIDKEDGVTIDDCEKMSRALDAPLDEVDFIKTSYCLEVCSPGIERELSTSEHFEKYLNNEIVITLIRPDNLGNKKIVSILRNFESDKIFIDDEDRNIKYINKDDIANIKLSSKIDFN